MWMNRAWWMSSCKLESWTTTVMWNLYGVDTLSGKTRQGSFISQFVEGRTKKLPSYFMNYTFCICMFVYIYCVCVCVVVYVSQFALVVVKILCNVMPSVVFFLMLFYRCIQYCFTSIFRKYIFLQWSIVYYWTWLRILHCFTDDYGLFFTPSTTTLLLRRPCRRFVKNTSTSFLANTGKNNPTVLVWRHKSPGKLQKAPARSPVSGVLPNIESEKKRWLTCSMNVS